MHMEDDRMHGVVKSWRGWNRSLLGTLGIVAASAQVGWAQETAQHRLSEPVFRVVNNNHANVVASPEPLAPLDEALKIASHGLQHIQDNVHDYTATLVKRERVDGDLGDYEYMLCKIRNRKVEHGKLVVPFGVYLGFIKPATVKGREVVYVENQNEGKLVAHEGGFRGRFLPTVSLHPESALAMRGQRYPLTEIGVENLVVKLIERGHQDRHVPDVAVDFRRDTKVNGRPCTMIQVSHPEPRAGYDFQLARIFIDDELKVPVRYAAYDWPAAGEADADGLGPVIEEYTYMNIKVNVGLNDQDFNPENPAYNFRSK
jgi:hypothetical protein